MVQPPLFVLLNMNNRPECLSRGNRYKALCLVWLHRLLMKVIVLITMPASGRPRTRRHWQQQQQHRIHWPRLLQRPRGSAGNLNGK